MIEGFGTSSARPIVVETTPQSVIYIDYTLLWQTTVTNGPSGIQTTRGDMTTTPSATLRVDGCGSAVASCMVNAYSQNGWISVWLMVQTGFLPWTGAAVAAACAFQNC